MLVALHPQSFKPVQGRAVSMRPDHYETVIHVVGRKGGGGVGISRAGISGVGGDICINYLLSTLGLDLSTVLHWCWHLCTGC